MAGTREQKTADDGFVDRVEGPGGSTIEQFDLQHHLRTLRKHKWPIVLFTSVVTALAAYYAFTATPVYRATSTLLIETQQNNVVSIEDLVGADTENQDYYQTQFELLRSPGLARRVIDRLDLWKHPELAPAELAGAASAEGAAGGSALEDPRGRPALAGEEVSEASLDGASVTSEPGTSGAPGTALNSVPGMSSLVTAPGAEYFDSRDVMQDERMIAVVANFLELLTISPIENTRLVEIRFDSTDPVFAARVANTVGEEYITSYLDARMELTTKASSWLVERLTSLKATLDESQARLERFKQENDLVDVDGSVGRLSEQELLLVSAELAQANSELAAAADLDRKVQALRDRPEALEAVPAVQSDPLVQNTKIQKGQARRELDELRNRYGERHPRVIDATSRLRSLDATLRGHIGRVVASIEQDHARVRQRVASIRAKLATGREEIQAIGTKKFGLDALEREVATNQEIYDTFFSRITEARSADGLEQANARISDYAAPPRFPIKPRKRLIIALAALAALLLSTLMAFLYERMDDTIKGTQDVEDRLGVRLLGILPLLKSGLFKRGNDLPLNPTEITDRKGTFTEAVKTVRTALTFADKDAHRRVIMVTSSVPGEGKSTSAINLAYSFAQLERVLLIDCDMRRPTIGKTADLDKNAPGLSSLIMRTSPPRECIHTGVFDGAVDIIPSGPIPEHPLELLSSRRFEKLLEKLGQHYDRIIVDCAPTQAVSDALMLSRLSDLVIYVVKSHDTPIEMARRGLQRLYQVDAKIAGVIITQVDIDKITAYGGDYYYQGYYDYYGYDENGERGGKLKLSNEELTELRTDDSDFDLDLDHDHDRRFARAIAAVDDDVREVDDIEWISESDADSRGSAYRREDTRPRVLDDLDLI